MARVLLIEDDSATTFVVARLLREQGHEVQAASTCKDAARLALGYNPEVIITDWLLPDGSGLQAARQIRADSGVRIILISGMPPEQFEQEVETVRPDAFLEKPFHRLCLETAVREALTTRRKAG